MHNDLVVLHPIIQSVLCLAHMHCIHDEGTYLRAAAGCRPVLPMNQIGPVGILPLLQVIYVEGATICRSTISQAQGCIMHQADCFTVRVK